MNTLITDAIRNRRVMNIGYGGYPRSIEPHAYGVSNEGSELLRAYQIHGGSDSVEQQGWKLFDLSKAGSISATQQTFSSARQGYKRGDKAMSRIYAEL